MIIYFFAPKGGDYFKHFRQREAINRGTAIIQGLRSFRSIVRSFQVRSNELTFLWNELTILWNDLTTDWNDLTWNDLTMERNDRIPIQGNTQNTVRVKAT